jgi:hypothetical protein
VLVVGCRVPPPPPRAIWRMAMGSNCARRAALGLFGSIWPTKVRYSGLVFFFFFLVHLFFLFFKNYLLLLL